jgi:hypothetical protein
MTQRWLRGWAEPRPSARRDFWALLLFPWVDVSA